MALTASMVPFLLSICFLVLCGSVQAHGNPAFAWSASPLFRDAQMVHTGVVPAEELVALVKWAAGYGTLLPESLSFYVQDQTSLQRSERPLVVFLTPEMSSDAISRWCAYDDNEEACPLSHLREHVKQARTSLSLPFTVRGSVPLSQALVESVRHHAHISTFRPDDHEIIQDDGIHAGSHSELLTTLEKGDSLPAGPWVVFLKGQEMNERQEDDTFMHRVIQAMEDRSGDYLAFLATDTTISNPPQTREEEEEETKEEEGDVRYKLINPTILTGLLVGLFLAFIALVGVSCLANVQTPTRWESQRTASQTQNLFGLER